MLNKADINAGEEEIRKELEKQEREEKQQKESPVLYHAFDRLILESPMAIAQEIIYLVGNAVRH